MLYPARWKEVTVDQSKVHKNRLFRDYYLGGGGGHPVCTYLFWIYSVINENTYSWLSMPSALAHKDNENFEIIMCYLYFQ